MNTRLSLYTVCVLAVSVLATVLIVQQGRLLCGAIL